MQRIRTHIADPEGDRIVTDLWIDELGQFVVTINIEIGGVHVCSIRRQDDDLKLWTEMTK